MKISTGTRIKILDTAPVSAQFIGRTGTLVRVLPNAVLVDIDGHGVAIMHREWGTKRNPGSLGVVKV